MANSMTCEKARAKLEEYRSLQRQLADLQIEVIANGFTSDRQDHFEAMKASAVEIRYSLQSLLEQFGEDLFAIERRLENYGYDGLVKVTQLQGRECYIAFMFDENNDGHYTQYFVFPDGTRPKGSLGNGYARLKSPSDGYVLATSHSQKGKRQYTFLIEATGEEQVSFTMPAIKEAHSFESGVAAIQDLDGKWRLYNTDFNIVGSPIGYEAMEPTSEGKTAVLRNGKWGFIDPESNVEHRFEWEEVNSYAENFAVAHSEGGWYFIDRIDAIHRPRTPNNVPIVKLKSFSDGFAAVQTNLGWHFVGKDMRVASEVYDKVFPFENGRAVVTRNGVSEIVDTNFKRVGEPLPHPVADVSDGIIICHETIVEETHTEIHSTVLFDQNGNQLNQIHGYALDEASFDTLGYALLEGPDDSYITINRSGNVILSPS